LTTEIFNGNEPVDTETGKENVGIIDQVITSQDEVLTSSLS
jgi:hypothetical protein